MASKLEKPGPARRALASSEGAADDLVFADEAVPAQPSPNPAPARAQSGFVFTPVWDAYHQILSTYVCVPARPLPSGMMGFGHELLGRGARDMDLAEFDRKTFSFAVETASAFQSNQAVVLLSFALDYGSLSSAKSRDCVIGAFRTMPRALSAVISLRIVNAPDDAAVTTLTERVGLLRPYFRAVTFQIRHLDQDMRRFAYMGLHGLAFRLGEGKDKALDFEQVAFVTRQAKSAKMQVLFDSVPNLGCAKRLADVGVAYLSGPFLGPALDKPVPVRRCSLEDLTRAQPR